MARLNFQFEVKQIPLRSDLVGFQPEAELATDENFKGQLLTTDTVVLRRQFPPMELVDELIMLLHVAAEIEHSLMVQYLYSAFSLPDQSPHLEWREEIMTIAREEMGHLMAVQNMLLSLGGALNFDREDYPYNDIYPFHFKLEPFSVAALAKYVLAEMPALSEIPEDIGFDLDEVKSDARMDAPDENIQRVGALFSLLAELAAELNPSDIQIGSEQRQADPERWSGGGVYNFVMTKVARISGQDGMIDLIKAIGLQGEGPDESKEKGPSHFLRFLELYRAAKGHAVRNGPGSLAINVPVNPTARQLDAEGFLENPIANKLGEIFNHRYRWLLLSIHHHLLAPPMSKERNQLFRWAFMDMGFLKNLSSLLVKQSQYENPRTDPFGRQRMAGAPFELPYSLNVPVVPGELWNYHRRFATHSLNQLNELNLNEQLISDLRTNDAGRIHLINQINL